MPTDARRRPPLRAWLAAGLFGALVAAAGAAALLALHARAARDAPEAAAPPLPVRVATLRFQDGYAAEERFAGRVEPARSARLAFERAGLVAAVLVEEGDAVAGGAPVARLDADALGLERRRLEAQRRALEADLALGEATLARAETLRDRGFETGQTLDEARYRVAALKARIAETDAALAAVDLDLEKSVIRAPFAGVLARRLLDEGAVVSPGAALGLLQETGRPRARIGLPAARARALPPGFAATLETPAGPVAARLAAVSPEIDPATRTVSALFDLDPAADLAMGAVVRLPLLRREPGRGAWAPLSALQEGERGLWTVYVVEESADGPRARRAAVEALHVAGGRAFLRGPLPDGARIVAGGLNRLTANRLVAPVAEAAE